MTGIGKSIVSLQSLSEHKMLFSLAWPVVVSLLTQGLYSFVDSIFLARLGAEVLSAVSLSFVVQNLASSFFTGIATGMNAIISRAIGRNDYDTGRKTVFCGFIIQALFSLCFMAFGVWGVFFYFTATTDNQAVIQYGYEYLTPVMVMSFAMTAQITAERLLQATGMSRFTLYSQAAGTVVNIILDPILIFGLFGCSEFGVKGAAYATVIGQLVAAFVAFYFNIRHNRMIFSDLKIIKPDWKISREIIKIGLPTAATGISSSFGNYFINRILVGFSSTANAAFGIYTKLQSIALMPTQGISSGLVTMYAFFYGKQDLGRIKKTLRAGEIMVEIWNLFCFCLFFFIPTILMIPFAPSAEMVEVGIPCFRIIGLTYLTSGLMTGLTAFFQAIGHSQYTFFVSLARTVFVRVPIAYFLASFGNISLLWWCWPISEVTSDTVCVILFIVCYRQFVKTLNLEKSEFEYGKIGG